MKSKKRNKKRQNHKIKKDKTIKARIQRGGIFGFSNQEQLIKHLETAVIDNGEIKFDSVEKHFDFCEKMIDLLYEWSKDPTYNFQGVLYTTMKTKNVAEDNIRKYINIFVIQDEKIGEIIDNKELCLRLSKHIRHIKKIVMGHYYNKVVEKYYKNPDEKSLDTLFCKDINNKNFRTEVAPIDKYNQYTFYKGFIKDPSYKYNTDTVTTFKISKDHFLDISLRGYNKNAMVNNLDFLCTQLIDYHNKLIDRLMEKYGKIIITPPPTIKKRFTIFLDFVNITDEFYKNNPNIPITTTDLFVKCPSPNNKPCKAVYLNYKYMSVLFLTVNESQVEEYFPNHIKEFNEKYRNSNKLPQIPK